MGKLPTEDRALPFRPAPSKFCPRKLACTPTKDNPEGYNAKRYMSAGPLFGYIIACPACGFQEMHEHRAAGYVEVDECATMTEKPVRCLNCSRVISIAGGVVLAVLTG